MDVLLATTTEKEYQQATREMLQCLGAVRKTQVYTKKATYLGYSLKAEKRNLSKGQTKAVLKISPTTTKRQV